MQLRYVFRDFISMSLTPHRGQILLKYTLATIMTTNHFPIFEIPSGVCVQSRLEGEWCIARLGTAKKKYQFVVINLS